MIYRTQLDSMRLRRVAGNSPYVYAVRLRVQPGALVSSEIRDVGSPH